MASTISTATIASAPVYDEPALRGVRRSRFSFHLNTRRSRRWLLVQLVSIPLDGPDNEHSALAIRHSREQAAPHKTLGQLVDNYSAARMCNRGV